MERHSVLYSSYAPKTRYFHYIIVGITQTEQIPSAHMCQEFLLEHPDTYFYFVKTDINEEDRIVLISLINQEIPCSFSSFDPHEWRNNYLVFPGETVFVLYLNADKNEDQLTEIMSRNNQAGDIILRVFACNMKQEIELSRVYQDYSRFIRYSASGDKPYPENLIKQLRERILFEIDCASLFARMLPQTETDPDIPSWLIEKFPYLARFSREKQGELGRAAMRVIYNWFKVNDNSITSIHSCTARAKEILSL